MPSITERPIAVAIAVVEHLQKYLVGIRPAGVPLAGMAEFPGGKVGTNETAETAAVRECKEESGLDVEVVEKYLSTLHRYDHGLLEIHFFRCRPIATGNVSTMPRSPFHWVCLVELAGLDFPGANAPLTEMLLREAKINSRG